jgi:hypothetical protein
MKHFLMMLFIAGIAMGGPISFPRIGTAQADAFGIVCGGPGSSCQGYPLSYVVELDEVLVTDGPERQGTADISFNCSADHPTIARMTIGTFTMLCGSRNFINVPWTLGVPFDFMMGVRLSATGCNTPCTSGVSARMSISLYEEVCTPLGGGFQACVANTPVPIKTYQSPEVPEPSTLWLAGLGVVALAMKRGWRVHGYY